MNITKRRNPDFRDYDHQNRVISSVNLIPRLDFYVLSSKRVLKVGKKNGKAQRRSFCVEICEMYKVFT